MEKLVWNYRYYEWTCFISHQATEKNLKALALKLGFKTLDILAIEEKEKSSYKFF